MFESYDMLPSKVRQAINVMINLAGSDGAPKTTPILAYEERSNLKYLEIILADLRRAGLIRAMRGPNGGFYLARPSKEIRALEIANAINGDLAPLPCLSEFASQCSECRNMATCPIKSMFEPSYHTLILHMNSLTLEDLASYGMTD
jgi:Rrf2 family protein